MSDLKVRPPSSDTGSEDPTPSSHTDSKADRWSL